MPETTREEATDALRLYRAHAVAGPAACTALDCVVAGADPRTMLAVIERALDGGADLLPKTALERMRDLAERREP